MIIDLDNVDTTSFDDNEDLSKLDRGDAIPSGDTTAEVDTPAKVEDKGDKAERDANGRFKPKAADKDVPQGDDEVDEVDDDEEDDDDTADTKGKTGNELIRLNKMRDQREAARQDAAAARAEIAALRAAQQPAKAPVARVDPTVAINADLDALYEKVEEARADGDIKVAASLQRQIDSKNREIVKIEAAGIAERTTSVATENVRYDTMLDGYEAQYDVINPHSDDFNPEAVKALEYYVEAHEKMGLRPTKALTQAVKLLFGDAPAKEADLIAKSDGKVVPLKKKPDVAKAIDTQRRQPADMSDRGANKDDTTIDAAQLSDEEYDALPLSKKKQMRGDAG